MTRPIFIFSPPRAGSTLVQRVLASHSAVATTSEPWLLLPLLTPLVGELPAEGGRDALVHEAFSDFVAELPRDRDDYRDAVRELTLELYGKLTHAPATHFVDKTPMYHLIVDEVVRTFPDAGFVFLFRNPLGVLASSIELFHNGRWEVARYHMALFQSFADLVPAFERHRSRSIRVRYEDMVTGAQQPWRDLIAYLQLPWEPEILHSFAGVELHGRMGDPRGTRDYTALSTAPLTKWRQTISNPLRKAWCAGYLRWLGADRLSVMGYDLDALLDELEQIPTTSAHVADDTYRMVSSLARELVKARLPGSSGSSSSTWRAVLGASALDFRPTES